MGDVARKCFASVNIHGLPLPRACEGQIAHRAECPFSDELGKCEIHAPVYGDQLPIDDQLIEAVRIVSEAGLNDAAEWIKQAKFHHCVPISYVNAIHMPLGNPTREEAVEQLANLRAVVSAARKVLARLVMVKASADVDELRAALAKVPGEK